jgi:Coenzyme PQQ synthesis protein D (PqqD)
LIYDLPFWTIVESGGNFVVAQSSMIRLKPDVFSLAFGGGLVVGDVQAGTIYVFNAAAGAIWLLLEAACSLDEVVFSLGTRFGLEQHEAREHVCAMIADWRKAGLIAAAAPLAHKGSAPSAVCRSTVRQANLYRVDGRVYSVATNDQDVADHVSGVLGGFTIAQAPIEHHLTALRRCSDGDIVLQVDGEERVRTDNAPEMIGAIFQTILELQRGSQEWLALLHGAAVAINGAGVLFSGASGSGKSTLTAYLAARGYDYLTDDLIALSAPRGEIIPWRVPHSIKRGAWEHLQQFYPALATAKIHVVGGREVRYVQSPPLRSGSSPPITPHLLIFPRYTCGRPATLEPISKLSALEMLIGDRLWLGNPIDEATVARFLQLLEQLPAFALTYGEMDEAEVLILDLLRRRSFERQGQPDKI